MKDTIVHKINGEKYVLLAMPVSEILMNNIDSAFASCGCILQSVKPKQSFWFGRKAELKILVPESKIMQFQSMITK